MKILLLKTQGMSFYKIATLKKMIEKLLMVYTIKSDGENNDEILRYIASIAITLCMAQKI